MFMNRGKGFYIAIIFLYSVLGVQAQESHHNIKLGVSAGYETCFGATKKPAQVREYESAYDDYFTCGFIGPDQTMGIFHASVQAEYFLLHNRIGLSSGLRFSQTSSSLKSDEKFFYWKFGEENVTTDYLRIQKITGQNYWLGIPLEFRFFPNRRDIWVQHYFKLGYSYNMRIGSHNSVSFENAEMNKYASDVAGQIAQSSSNYSYFYPAFGLKIGRFKNDKHRFPWINLEFHFPGVLFAENVSPFFKKNVNIGVGFQISVQIPLGTNVPIGHK